MSGDSGNSGNSDNGDNWRWAHHKQHFCPVLDRETLFFARASNFE
jgi:hypothetical protein